MENTPKFVIQHAEFGGRRNVLRLLEGQTHFVPTANSDLYRSLVVGTIHRAGSAYCVHLNGEIPFTRELMRDVRTEIALRAPWFSSTPPVAVR